MVELFLFPPLKAALLNVLKLVIGQKMGFKDLLMKNIKRNNNIHFFEKKKVLNLFKKYSIFIILLFLIIFSNISDFSCSFSQQFNNPERENNFQSKRTNFIANGLSNKSESLFEENNQSVIKVRLILNITIRLESPYPVYINSNETFFLNSDPVNYSVELDSFNHSYSLISDDSITWLLNTQDYEDGYYLLRLFIQFNDNSWIIHTLNLMIDNSAPLIAEIKLSWESIEPEKPIKLVINVTDLSTIIKIRIIIRKLTTHDLILNKTFYNPPSTNVTVMLPGLPLGFHGYIKVQTEDDLGNVDDGSESYNFKVRSIGINNIILNDVQSSFTGRYINHDKRTYVLFRGHYYNVVFNLTNLLNDDESERYYGEIILESEIIEDWDTEIDSEEFNYHRSLSLTRNGSCGKLSLNIRWFRFSSESEDIIQTEIYSEELNVYILPAPSTIMPVLITLNLIVLICTLIFYQVFFRYYGKFRFKEKLLFPKQNRKVIVGLIILTGFLWWLLIFGSIIPISENIILPFLLNTLNPQYVLFTAFFFILLTILLYISFKMAGESTVNLIETIKNHKIPDRFHFFITTPFIVIQLIYTSLVLINLVLKEKLNLKLLILNAAKDSVTRSIPVNLFFEIIIFLSVIFGQLFLLRYFNRYMKERNISSFEKFYVLLVLIVLIPILFSFFYLIYFPLSILFTIPVFLGITTSIIFHFVFNTYYLRSFSIVPSDWTKPSLSFLSTRPQFWNVDLIYEIKHPPWITVTAKLLPKRELNIKKLSESSSKIIIQEPIEFGIYKIEIYLHFKLMDKIFRKVRGFLPSFPKTYSVIKFIRSFEIEPYVDEKIVFSFLESLNMVIERVIDYDLDYSSSEGSKVYKIISTDESYKQFIDSIVYMITEPASVNVVRDCFDTILIKHIKNKKFAIMIIPIPMDVYAALQRTLYHSKDEITIIPLLYPKILEITDFKENKRNLWRLYFDDSIKRYAVMKNLFDYTRAIDPIDHPNQFFFGREEIIAKLQGLCELKQPFAILGFTKIGKSSIANVLIRSFRDVDIAFVLGISFVYKDTIDELLKDIWLEWRDNFFSRFLEADITKLSYNYENPLNSYRNLIKFYRKEVKNQLNKTNTKIENFVIIFDELTGFMRSNLPQNEKEKFLSFLRFLTDEFSFLTVGIILHDDDVTQNPKYPTSLYFKEIWVTGLNHSDSNQMILGLANQMRINFSEKLAEKITYYWDGNPFLIRSFCSLLFDKFGSNIPEVSDESMQELRKDEHFSRREHDTFWKMWYEQLSEQERKLLVTLAEKTFKKNLHIIYQKELQKLILKGVISDSYSIRSLAFREWIKYLV